MSLIEMGVNMALMPALIFGPTHMKEAVVVGQKIGNASSFSSEDNHANYFRIKNCFDGYFDGKHDYQCGGEGDLPISGYKVSNKFIYAGSLGTSTHTGSGITNEDGIALVPSSNFGLNWITTPTQVEVVLPNYKKEKICFKGHKNIRGNMIDFVWDLCNKPDQS